jgi:hypothetical protein
LRGEGRIHEQTTALRDRRAVATRPWRAAVKKTTIVKWTKLQQDNRQSQR